MYIQTSEYLKAPREIHADSLGTLVAQLSLADIAVLLEFKQQQLMVFLGMRENVCLTSEVESVSVNGDCIQINLETATYSDVLQSPEFSEVAKKLPSADIVKLVPRAQKEATPDDPA